MYWTIKQAMEKTGIPADTLRYYEKEGIISPKRHENRYRYYDENDITILKLIVVMKHTHFSIAEIKSMERLFATEQIYRFNDNCKNTLNTKIAEINQLICNYQKITHLMEELLAMVGNADLYQKNEIRIAEFIDQIFEDIRRGCLFAPNNEINKNENN